MNVIQYALMPPEHGRDDRAQHEGLDLDQRGVDALRAGGDLVVACRLHPETEPGPFQQQIAHGECDRRGGEHRVVEEVVVEADRRRESAGATGEVEDCGELAYRLGQRPGRDGEVRALQPQRRPADQRRNGARDHGRDRKGRPEVPVVLGLHQDRRGVRADAEECDMAEADVAGVPADHVPGQRESGPHRDAGGDPDVVRRRHHRQQTEQPRRRGRARRG